MSETAPTIEATPPPDAEVPLATESSEGTSPLLSTPRIWIRERIGDILERRDGQIEEDIISVRGLTRMALSTMNERMGRQSGTYGEDGTYATVGLREKSRKGAVEHRASIARAAQRESTHLGEANKWYMNPEQRQPYLSREEKIETAIGPTLKARDTKKRMANIQAAQNAGKTLTQYERELIELEKDRITREQYKPAASLDKKTDPRMDPSRRRHIKKRIKTQHHAYHEEKELYDSLEQAATIGAPGLLKSKQTNERLRTWNGRKLEDLEEARRHREVAKRIKREEAARRRAETDPRAISRIAFLGAIATGAITGLKEGGTKLVSTASSLYQDFDRFSQNLSDLYIAGTDRAIEVMAEPSRLMGGSHKVVKKLERKPTPTEVNPQFRWEGNRARRIDSNNTSNN